jgi:N-acetylneuraminic acid mutarotase
VADETLDQSRTNNTAMKNDMNNRQQRLNRHQTTLVSLGIMLLGILGFVPTLAAQGTAFTYQGQLVDNGLPANGTYNFQFDVRDALTAGNAVGTNPITATLIVSNGLFTVTLDPGPGVFTGPDRWLEVSVATNGVSTFNVLSPRQKLTPTPYAITAGSVTGPINGGLITSGSITATQLGSGAVTSAKLATGAVTATQLASGAVTSAKLAAGAVTSASLAAGAVTATTLASGAVTGAKLAAGAVTATNLAAGSVMATNLAAGAVAANLNASSQSGVGSGGLVLSATPMNPALVNAGYVEIGFTTLSDAWQAGAVGKPLSDRSHSTAVWTGSEMLVWGGGINNTANSFSDGAAFNPAANNWTLIPIGPAGKRPAARQGHAAVWTGTEMIVWGGGPGDGATFYNDGGRYNPTTGAWASLSTTNAPIGRYKHTAVWSGSEMIVWGGVAGGATSFNNGGRYNPATDTWTTVNTSGAPAARNDHTAVWTGTEMIVWGGATGSAYLNDGGRYNPAADSWTAVSLQGVPTARAGHTAVWIGSQMIVWGGIGTSVLSDGARYTPSTDAWGTMSTVGAPSARAHHTAVWTGSQMVVWGGQTGATGSTYLNDGGVYTPFPTPSVPLVDTWTGISTNAAPSPRFSHTAVWTGVEMIVWGGVATGPANTGSRYNPLANTWLALVDPNAPTARANHTAVWTGSEMIVWGGGNPGTLNDGGRYNPVADTWAPFSTVGAPVGRSYHSAVWTGSEMIVWGGQNQGILNDGGRYSPAANTWVAVGTTGAPSPRYYHTAVWTGTEMIVWGGDGSSGGAVNDGGRYSPGGNVWKTVSLTGAPAPRYRHIAVWTGNEMIVWGGIGVANLYNDGGRYNPAANSWTPLSLTGAPLARSGHHAFWTGNEMIVWGGSNFTTGVFFNDGARYNLAANTWIPISLAGAPSPRDTFSAVWTGREMIVWGGVGPLASYYADTFQYTPGSVQYLYQRP